MGVPFSSGKTAIEAVFSLYIFRRNALDNLEVGLHAAGGLDGLEDGDDVVGGGADGVKTFHEFLDVGSVFEAYGLGGLVLDADLRAGDGCCGAAG